MNDNETFWMVWCPNRGEPSHRHATEESAIEEARRIAAKEKKPVYVLACIGEAAPQEPPVEWRKYDKWKPVEKALFDTGGANE
jgi:hypothetical protein